MRKGRDGEDKTKQNKTKQNKENNDGNSGPLSSLPVDPLNGDRQQRRRSCQNMIPGQNLLGLWNLLPVLNVPLSLQIMNISDGL